MFSRVNGWLHRRYKSVSKKIDRWQYLRKGSIPQTPGYLDYRNDLIHQVLLDSQLCERFRRTQELPKGYGYRLDERVVEYPWVLSRLDPSAMHLLDAGSALNLELLLQLPILSTKKIVIYNLSPESNPLARANVSYIYGDLRDTILKDQLFEEIVCISTLEHIGLDNTLVYTRDPRFRESRPLDYRGVLREFRRLLVPGGRLFLTVPFGRYENHGWLQQFDQARLLDILDCFGGDLKDQTFYRYTAEGWILSNGAECADCEYFDFYARPSFDRDYATAARAVACILLST